MPTPTTRNGFRKPDPGSDNNTWGANLNAAVFDLVDSSLDGWTVISASGTTTLSSTQYVANQARMRCLKYTALTTGTLVIPSVEKWYVVWAETAPVVVSNGGSSVTVAAGDQALVITDGATVKIAENRVFTDDVSMSNNQIKLLATPTAATDASTKQYVDTAVLSASAGNLPGYIGNAGRTIQVTDAETGYQVDVGVEYKTSNFTAVRNHKYLINTNSGAVTMTLPASPIEGDIVKVSDGGYSNATAGFGLNNLTVGRNGKTIMGLSEDMTVSRRAADFTLVYSVTAGTWKVF